MHLRISRGELRSTLGCFALLCGNLQIGSLRAQGLMYIQQILAKSPQEKTVRAKELILPVLWMHRGLMRASSPQERVLSCLCLGGCRIMAVSAEECDALIEVLRAVSLPASAQVRRLAPPGRLVQGGFHPASRVCNSRGLFNSRGRPVEHIIICLTVTE